ncbi:hypothetical protein, partial [Nonomuraea sp. JJY05]|uniref:hypothetical protein n=1 Tax=Nonomuraea sp. JJY05 TaxID=3350255 RepID=UPI00373F956A
MVGGERRDGRSQSLHGQGLAARRRRFRVRGPTRPLSAGEDPGGPTADRSPPPSTTSMAADRAATVPDFDKPHEAPAPA